MAASSSTLLRVVTQRLSNTPSTQLAHVAPILAGNISECRESLSVPQSGTLNKGSPDNAILVHKLKNQLCALLQDRTPHARYAAVILIKAIVEVGNYEILQGTALWIKGLINILGVSSSLTALPNKFLRISFNCFFGCLDINLILQ